MLHNSGFQELEELLLEEELTDVDSSKAQLVVFNDDYNTFEWVIKCFVEVLKHAAEQAEQCAMIIHFKGKAIVKTAPVNVLKPFKDALIERGLSVVIEEDKD